MSREFYRFEPVEENAAGFGFNQRVRAVYKLAGFIHRTFRNHPDQKPGKPVWQYFERGGAISGIESEQSVEDVEMKIERTGIPASVPGIPMSRLYVGLRTRSGQDVLKSAVIDLISGSLESFTALEGDGSFRGSEEPVMVVCAAEKDPSAIWHLAEALRVKFDQDGVGVEIDGRYHRVTGGLECDDEDSQCSGGQA